jgi:hypothetical protein
LYMTNDDAELMEDGGTVLSSFRGGLLDLGGT